MLDGVYMKNLKHLLVAVLFALTIPLSAQAGSDEFEANDYLSFSKQGQASNIDPLEGINRTVRDFNAMADLLVLRPVSGAYTAIMPQFARTSIYNFLENIQAPVVFVNSILQGDAQNVFVTFWRFVFNTTLGVGGLFDIATDLGIPERNSEDFGQTLGVWGIGQGAYLELPLLGPSSLRDAPSMVIDVLINPFTYALKSSESYAIVAARTVDTRARLDKYISQTNDTSIDPYATFRSLYLQHRKGLVNNFETKASFR